MKRYLATLLVLAGASAFPLALAAQQDSTLLEAVRLVTEGQGDSAQAIVRAKLRSVSPADSTYPEILFTAGLVASQGDSAISYFRRVSIEYSQSRWADRALLKLAQFSFASGDYTSARKTTDRILLDYPLSDVKPEAAYWGARSYLATNDLRHACRLFRLAAQDSTANVELKNRVRFYLQRCNAVAADTSSDSTKTVTPKPSRPTYTVQVAAVRSAAQADQVMRKLKRAGFTAHVVRSDDGFLKIRVGHYRSKSRAQRVQRDIRKKTGDKGFVVEER